MSAEAKLQKFLCPVCGFNMDDPPANYNICPSCGTEFGYDDFSRKHEALRDEWVKAGARWFSKYQKEPANWNPISQMAVAGISVEQYLSKPDMEGPEASARFDALTRKLLSASHEEIIRREEEYRKKSDANPNKRGPKPKPKNGGS